MPFLAIVYDARTGQREQYVPGGHMYVFQIRCVKTQISTI